MPTKTSVKKAVQKVGTKRDRAVELVRARALDLFAKHPRGALVVKKVEELVDELFEL